jgi:ABC-type transport system involved in cytochrome bd biosynthesis fused ATPase/permease subunit
MIGDTEEGLSGGERRRLAIGIELLKNSSSCPSLILFDW